MKQLLFVGGLGMALLITRPVGAQDEVCVGDCNGDLAVAINELILCVNIVLGNADVDACPACDSNMDGIVGIADLVAAVGNSLGSCDVGGDLICGDSVVDEGEDCDDGNNFGGDGCAANCMNETRRLAVFAAGTASTVQTASFPVQVNLSGSQVFTTGSARDETVTGPGGQVITRPGEIPVVVRVEDVVFDPASVIGITCACIRVLEVPEFGQGIAATGVIGCGANGLTDVNVRVVQDHNTTPGDPGNSGPALGLPDDPECDDTFTLPDGITLPTACVEGSGEHCSEANFPHDGVCNSPRVVEFSGGMAPRGSGLMTYQLAIGLLQDAGQCRQDPPNCAIPDYGPDCMACTDDDLDLGVPLILPATTGFAEAVMFDANNTPGAAIAETPPDGPSFCLTGDCIVSASGSPLDCDALAADPTGGLPGSALAIIFPAIDSRQIGDNVTSVAIRAE